MNFLDRSQGDQSGRGAYVGEGYSGGGGSLSENQSWLHNSSYAQEQSTYYQQESSQYNTDYSQETYGSHGEDDEYSSQSYHSLGDTGPQEYERTEDYGRSSYHGSRPEEGGCNRSDEYTHHNEGYNPSYEQQIKHDSSRHDDDLGEEYNIQRENHEVYGGNEDYGDHSVTSKGHDYSSRKSSSNRYEGYGQNEDYSSDHPEFYEEQNFGRRSGYRPNDGGGETYDDGDEYREDEY